MTTTLTKERLQEIEALIADKKIAQLDMPGGYGGEKAYRDAEWKGEDHWPVFIGYPDIAHVAQIPFGLVEVRKDPATSCTVYVQSDELKTQTKSHKDKEAAEPSNIQATSKVPVAAPEPTQDKVAGKTK